MSDKTKKKSIFSNVFFQIYFAGVIILTFFDPIQLTKKVYPSARYKACYSNIRVIQGAVEMYNIDAGDVERMMTSLNQGILRESHYIKASVDLICPETSKKGTYSGEHLTDDGEIICSYHGGLIAKGPYNIDRERENQIGNKILKFTEKYAKNFLCALFWPIQLVALMLFMLCIIP